jgi:hypothetical protein
VESWIEVVKIVGVVGCILFVVGFVLPKMKETFS